MRFARTVIFILVCLGILWLIVMLFGSIFSSGNKTTPMVVDHLSSYARIGTSAQLITDGPIVLNQEHRSLRITVDSSASKIELINGYDGSVVRQDTYPNTVESYGMFLRALDGVGFTLSKKSTIPDERGQCPLQYRYVYKLSDYNREVYRFWSTSCGTGNFGGVRSSVRTLFQKQIPSKVYSEYSRALSQ